MGKRRKRRRKRLARRFEITLHRVFRGPTNNKDFEHVPYGTAHTAASVYLECKEFRIKHVRVPKRFAGTMSSIKQWLNTCGEVGEEFLSHRRTGA